MRWRRFATEGDNRPQLFSVVDVIAGHRWIDAEIPGLLLQLNAAMADEVEAIATLTVG